MHFLGKNGWLANVRGKGGGLELAHVPARITSASVVRQTEGAAVAAECFADAGGDCVIAPVLPAARRAGRSGRRLSTPCWTATRWPTSCATASELATVLFMERPHAAAMRDQGVRVSQPAFPYEGPQELLAPIDQALRRVVDPEVAMNIVDVGLVYGVTVDAERVHVRVTMTSAACPVADVIIGDIEQQLDRVVPAELLIQVELVWEPPWTPERMSDSAKRFMGW